MAKGDAMQRQAVLNYKKNGGNMEQAMLDAGYAPSTARKQQSRLLRKVGIEIGVAQKEIDSPKIKTIAEIQEFWSDNMCNDELEMSHRIKSSELLAKSQGGFVENLNVNGNINNPLAGFTTDELKRLLKK